MRLRPAGTGVRRPLALIGALLVVAAGCANPPTRERTDADVLVELDGAHRATVTLEANDLGFLAPIAEPRGGPTTTTTVPRPPTPEEVAAFNDALSGRTDAAPSDITTEVQDRRVAFTAIGRALAPDAVVTDVRITPNRIVGKLRFAEPMRRPLRLEPAALARSLHRGGLSRDATVWVGVCIPETRGHWLRTPDAFDRLRGCAGWVPDRRAATVGVLVPGAHTSSTFWPGIGLAVVALTLVGLVVARVRSGHRAWYALLAAAAVIGALVASVVLIHVVDQTNDLHDAFATQVERPQHDHAGALVAFGVLLVVAGIVGVRWLARDPDRERRPRRLGPMDPEGQAPNRSLRGSSV